MAKVTHLVVAYDHDTKELSFDGDGSREWIRTLFLPETNTWDDDAGDFVAVPESVEVEAVNALKALGVIIPKESKGWQTR